MLEQQIYERPDVREIVELNPWVRLVSATPDRGLIVSHLPVIVDPDSDELSILGHLARADADEHELGEHDAVVIVEGPHGYISPSWYQAGPYVPTWNFVVAHLYGRPTVLDDEKTFDILERTVDHFEDQREVPWRLSSVDGYARRIAPGVTGFRLTPIRCVGKAKLSQEKPTEVGLRVAAALENDLDWHSNPDLAATMREVLVSDA